MDSKPADSNALETAGELSFSVKTATRLCLPFLELNIIEESPRLDNWEGSVTVPTKEDRES